MKGTTSRAMDLEVLVAALDEARVVGTLERVALGIVHDSRAVRSGSVFVALRGAHADGHAFVAGAIAAGAAIGFLAAGTAVAWAPPAPYPGLCWYYTDATQRSGFWDSCP